MKLLNKQSNQLPAFPLALALLDNLFFVAKLKAAATQTGWELQVARTGETALAHACARQPTLIVLDLDATACRPFEFIKAVKAEPTLSEIPLLGFVSHVNTGVQQQAREAGCDRVLARSVFSRDLPALLQAAIKSKEPSNG